MKVVSRTGPKHQYLCLRKKTELRRSLTSFDTGAEEMADTGVIRECVCVRVLHSSQEYDQRCKRFKDRSKTEKRITQGERKRKTIS